MEGTKRMAMTKDEFLIIMKLIGRDIPENSMLFQIKNHQIILGVEVDQLEENCLSFTGYYSSEDDYFHCKNGIIPYDLIVDNL